MYTITGDQVSFRLNAQEKAEINELALLMQSDENETFTNSKQIVFAVIARMKVAQIELLAIESKLKTAESNLEAFESKLISIESEPKTDENNTLSEERKQRFYEAKIQLGYSENEEMTETDILDELLQVIKQPLPAAEIVEINVPIKLTENQVLLNLNEAQKVIIQTIAERRFKNGEDKELNSNENQIIEIVFQRQTLFNWAGDYPTYLKISELKK